MNSTDTGSSCIRRQSSSRHRDRYTTSTTPRCCQVPCNGTNLARNVSARDQRSERSFQREPQLTFVYFSQRIIDTWDTSDLGVVLSFAGNVINGKAVPTNGLYLSNCPCLARNVPSVLKLRAILALRKLSRQAKPMDYLRRWRIFIPVHRFARTTRELERALPNQPLCRLVHPRRVHQARHDCRVSGVCQHSCRVASRALL